MIQLIFLYYEIHLYILYIGYFTSRPSLKYLIKYSDNLLQSAKQLNVLSGRKDKSMKNILPLQEALGITQHHDAVSGTCKQFVNDDYVRMISKATERVEQSIIESMKDLINNAAASLTFCNQLNISECSATETIGKEENVVMNAYNPLAHSIKHIFRIPVVADESYSVSKSGSNEIIPSQVSTIYSILFD